MCGQVIADVSVGAESVRGGVRPRNPSAVNTPSDSAVCVPIVVRMEVHILNMQFSKAMGLYFVGLCGSVLLGLYSRLVALMHHFLGV